MEGYESVSVHKKLKQRGGEYGRLLWDYRNLFLAGAFLFGIDVILCFISTSFVSPWGCNTVALCTNEASPWGIFTSVFLYDGWENLPVYFLILMAYVSFGGTLQPSERQNRARFGSVAIFASAFIANALWLIAKPLTYSWGPSGVVYALWGVLFAFTLFDGVPKRAKSLNPRTWYDGRKERDSAVGNLALFASTVVFLSLEPAQFLSASPGVNVFAHSISFLGGFFSGQVYSCRQRASQRNRELVEKP